MQPLVDLAPRPQPLFRSDRAGAGRVADLSPDASLEEIFFRPPLDLSHASRSLHADAAPRRGHMGIAAKRENRAGSILILFFAGMLTIGLAGVCCSNCSSRPTTWPRECVRSRLCSHRHVRRLAHAGADVFGQIALAFTPAEVEFLFPAPLRAGRSLPTNSPEAHRTVRSWPSFSPSPRRERQLAVTAIGLFLTIEFFQLSAVAVALVRQTASVYAYTWTRRAALVAGVSILAWRPDSRCSKTPPADRRESVDSFRNSWIGDFVACAFQPFCQLCGAQELNLVTAGYAAAAAAIDAVLIALIMLLDAAYLETAAAVSEKRYRRVRQLKRGVWSSNVRPIVRARLPMPPRLAGAGPIAWRQLLHLARSSTALLYSPAVALALAPPC